MAYMNMQFQFQNNEEDAMSPMSPLDHKMMHNLADDLELDDVDINLDDSAEEVVPADQLNPKRPGGDRASIVAAIDAADLKDFDDFASDLENEL